MSETLVYRYDIYIGAPAPRVWQGLIDGELTRQYVYGTKFESKLKSGASYAYRGDGGFHVVDGVILAVEPEKRLAMTWSAHYDKSVAGDRPSRVTYELTPIKPSLTKLQLVHDDFTGATATYTGSVDAWPLILSSLKTLLETGTALPGP
jgi:uncharacterized protein YndB with AHSA1/START domain